MKLTKFFTLTVFLGIALMLQFSGCQEGAIAPVANSGSELSDEEQIQKLIEEDESLNSFEANYNEEEAMSLLTNGLAKAIYPIKVGHRMKLVNRNVNVEIVDDSAFAHVANTFEGTLYILASYSDFDPGDSNIVDTLIEKPFSTVVTHNVIFARRNDFGFFGNGNSNGNGDRVGNKHRHPGNHDGRLGDDHVGDGSRRDRQSVFGDLYRWAWKIVAISLIEGGTGSENIVINNLTLTLPDGEEIFIDSPNEYFMYREPGRPDQVPTFSPGESILMKVELQSAYADTDFVCITFGAKHNKRYDRKKMRLEMVSEEFDGQFYSRVYQVEWVSRPDRGPKHAVLNASPKQVIFDDETPVEAHTWGVPYIIN